MNKEMQTIINDEVMKNFNRAIEEYNSMPWSQIKFTRLRTCSAEVCETEHYFILRSYATFIAVIHKPTFTCYDALRKVYGYTRTSAQHIAKFCHDYPHYTNSGCRKLSYYYCYHE